MIEPSTDPQHALNDFLYADPCEIIGATETPRIMVINMHGDEQLAARVGHHIYTNQPELLRHVDYVCGNPVAMARGRRGTAPENDLNRSFRPDQAPQTYEERRAQRLLPILRGYDYVLDLHTSDTECGRFFLAANPDKEAVRDIIGSSTIERVVVMPEGIAGRSLIGNVANSISVEYNEILASQPEAIEEVMHIINGLINRTRVNYEREFYYVDRAVPKTEDPGNVHNFVHCAAGYYPVLFGNGPKTYRNNPAKKYLGFAASRMERVTA